MSIPGECGNDDKLSKEEVFAKMNASAEKMLSALEGAYQAGKKDGLSDDGEDKLIELLRKTKQFRDLIKQMTNEK